MVAALLVFRFQTLKLLFAVGFHPRTPFEVRSVCMCAAQKFIIITVYRLIIDILVKEEEEEEEGKRMDNKISLFKMFQMEISVLRIHRLL